MKKFLLLSALILFSSSAQAEKMTVLLDWFINPDHAPLFVAQEKGFFKTRGWKLHSRHLILQIKTATWMDLTMLL